MPVWWGVKVRAKVKKIFYFNSSEFVQGTYQKRISNLGLMSMSRATPTHQKNPSKQPESAGSLLIPTNVTRADLAARSERSMGSQAAGASLKKALSETESNFQAELDKTTKISHLFSKSSLLSSPATTGGYKDLVLNVLKKKTQIWIGMFLYMPCINSGLL